MKEFEVDQLVEIQREAGHTVRWEPCFYAGRVTGMRGWHRVRALDPVRRINSMTGMETNADDPQGFITDSMIVPTRRIRSGP